MRNQYKRVRLLIAHSVYDYVAAIRSLAQFPEQVRGEILPVYNSWRDESASWDLFPAHLVEEERVISQSAPCPLPDPVALYNELPIRPAEHIVVGLRDSLYAYTAVLHAYITGRTFVYVENIEELVQRLQLQSLSGDISITICAEQEIFDQKSLNYLFSSMSQDFLPDRPILRNVIGFLTAPTVGALSFLLMKTYYYPAIPDDRRSLLIMPFASKTTIPPAETYDTLCREDCSGKAIQASLETPRRVVVFYSHSHEDCIFLGADILESATSPSFGNRLSHIRDYQGFSLPSTAIRCQVLLANMCAGIKFVNGLHPSVENIGLGFVTGWPACYIAPTAVKNSISPEAFLFLHLMHAGCSAGETMRAMNAALANLSADPQIYVLVGDPLVRVAPPEPTLPAEIVQIQEEKIICRLDMPATTTGLIGICHSHLSTWIREGDCYLSSVELVGETRKLIDVEYLLLPSSRPDELLLILCSSFSLGPGSIYVTLTAQPPISSREAAMLEQCLTRIEHLTALSLFPHKLLGTQTELRNLVKNTLLFARAKHNVSAYQKAQQNKAKMLILLDKLQKETLASLLERLSQNTLAFTERYADQFLSTHCGWIEAVCTCGEPLHYRVLAHFIMRSIKRCIFLCPRCGIINDSPEDNEIFADIAGPITLSQHKPTTLLLRVQNTAEHNLICRVALGVEYSKFMPGGFTVEPSLVTLGIQAGGTETIPFGVTCNTDSPQGVYFLKAFVMYDMHLICLHRPFSIG